ncbi:MAG: hypothetical protein UW92_C0033G0015 [Candidatus Jorgensenbacteria bacterium GW2011_GWA2_45_13]|uniref:Uncharacterized protein n=1 Tax=Candidatus Jorgensenbacteria bacterium GW2011_GWA2_45_13 TaxID=1618662 RepID=A0A0G1L4F4_9BACT|nr:MAG: hypothetical protein UW92_C0033G0015 [Candidatus Jorgensenbacteria bacterium GW2011_GWA2_45_13]
MFSPAGFAVNFASVTSEEPGTTAELGESTERENVVVPDWMVWMFQPLPIGNEVSFEPAPGITETPVVTPRRSIS